MEESILNNKWVLGINRNEDVLNDLKKKILNAAPNCHFEKATTYQEAFEYLVFFMYDLVILDDALSRSRDLLDFAVKRPFPVPVAILTSHAATPETLKSTKEAGAKVVLPMEKLDDIIPILEYVVWYESLPPSARFFENLREFFHAGLPFSKGRDSMRQHKIPLLRNRNAFNNGYKADISLGWTHSYLKLKNHFNCYFESNADKEINSKWRELKSETEVGFRSDVKV
jgi:hypothetical protein